MDKLSPESAMAAVRAMYDYVNTRDYTWEDAFHFFRWKIDAAMSGQIAEPELSEKGDC